MKTTTLRMPIDLVEALEIIAEVQGKSLSAVIREAIEICIDDHIHDAEFRTRLATVIKEMQERAAELGKAFD